MRLLHSHLPDLLRRRSGLGPLVRGLLLHGLELLLRLLRDLLALLRVGSGASGVRLPELAAPVAPAVLATGDAVANDAEDHLLG